MQLAMCTGIGGGTNPSLLEAPHAATWSSRTTTRSTAVARDAALYFQGAPQLAHHLQAVRGWTIEARQSIADRARAIVARHYTWGQITDTYESLIQTELADCTPQAPNS